MTREIEEPVTKKSPSAGHSDQTVTTHPAFAQIGASRVSGNTALYDSDFRHNAYMTIRICRSELHRTLNRDWHHGQENIIEVALSEAQWATFVSSPNIGSGVPCTIQRLGYEGVPGLPDPQNRTEQFKDELRQKLDGAVERVKGTLDGLDGMGLPKGKTATIRNALERLLMELRSNLPFVAEQFDEHMENTVEHAKQEVHGYMTGVLHRAGLDALANGQMPLQIEVRPDADTGDQSRSLNES